MERKTLLLAFIPLLTLLAMTNGAITVVRTTLDVQDFLCRWEQSNDRLVCGFTQLGPEALQRDLKYNLTLDNWETVRCQQKTDNKSAFQCIYEGLREKEFVINESHKLDLCLETGNELQTQEFSLNLVQESKLASIIGRILYIALLIILTLFVLYCTIGRKLWKMSNLIVTLPDFNSQDYPINIHAQK